MHFSAKELLQNVTWVFVSFLIACLALEGLLVVSGIAATAVHTQPVNAEAPYIHAKPNHEYRYAKGPYGEIVQEHKTNNYGFKTDVQFSEESEGPKALYIGGSLILAEQVAPEEASGSILHKETGYEVYPIATSKPILSQHLAYAQFGVTEFKPDKIIFLITKTSFEESLLSRAREPGKHYFDEANNFSLQLINYQPSALKMVLREIALVNYLYKNISIGGFFKGKKHFDAKRSGKGTADPEMIEKIKTAFFDGVKELELAPSQILFVFVEEEKDVYADQARSDEHPFILFARQAKARGHKVLDLHDVFRTHYREHQQPFEFEIDGHWNAMANRLVADTIIKDGFLSQ